MRALRAAGSALLLLMILAAPPLLLMRFIGNPWPAEGVAWDAPLTDGAILGLLAALAWLLWLQSVLCVLAEAAAALTDDRVRPQAPLTFGFQQHLARRLVSTIVIATVSTPLFASGGAAATGPTLPPQSPSPTSASHARLEPTHVGHVVNRGAGAEVTDDQPNSAAPIDLALSDRSGQHPQVDHHTITVMRLDTLWSISERVLGAGDRWPEIAALNEGRLMTDGSRFVSVDSIRPGWELLIPGNQEAAESSVTVRPGDSLSGIADRTLHDANKWPNLYAANRATIGADPDLIQPGQVLRLPVVRPAHHGGEELPTSASRIGFADDRRSAAMPSAPPATGVPNTGPDQQPLPAQTSMPDGTSSDERRQPASTGEQQVQNSTSSPTSGLTALRALLATAICLAAGVGALLASNRRRQFRGRRPGRAVHEPPRELQRLERVVHEASLVAEPTARFVDLALRALAAAQRTSTAPMPRIGVAILDTDRLTLLLTDPALEGSPDTWEVSDDGRVWSISRHVELDESQSSQPAPYPALVSVAEDAQGRTWFLDLEAVGVLAVAGDRRRADEALRFLAAELAVNAWADGTEVLLSDNLAEDLIELNPRRIQRVDPEAATRRAVAWATTDPAANDLLERRRDDVAIDTALPLVVVCSAADTPIQTEPAFAPWTGAVLARVGRDETAPAVTPTLTVDAEGTARIVGFDNELTLFGLAPDLGRAMASLLAQTRVVTDEPMPHAIGESAVADVTTADGALRPDLTLPHDPTGNDRSILALADHEYVEHAATTESDVAQLAPVVPAIVTAQVLALDPTLDADLEAWFDEKSERPKIRVIGPVDVSATAGDREHVANKGGTVEFIVYLACHEHGATKDRAAEDLGWTGTTIHNRARDARRILGQRPDGTEWLPDATKSDGAKRRGVATYELHPETLVDADLFRRLRTRASARGVDGLEDLVTALSLVQGEPFDQLRRGGYGWILEGDRLDHHLCASIADVAHLVASQALVESDLKLARSACHIALTADPYSEVAQLDLAAVVAAEGTSPDHLIQNQIIDRLDEDPATRTEEVLKARGWLAS